MALNVPTYKNSAPRLSAAPRYADMRSSVQPGLPANLNRGIPANLDRPPSGGSPRENYRRAARRMRATSFRSLLGMVNMSMSIAAQESLRNDMAGRQSFGMGLQSHNGRLQWEEVLGDAAAPWEVAYIVYFVGARYNDAYPDGIPNASPSHPFGYTGDLSVKSHEVRGGIAPGSYEADIYAEPLPNPPPLHKFGPTVSVPHRAGTDLKTRLGIGPAYYPFPPPVPLRTPRPQRAFNPGISANPYTFVSLNFTGSAVSAAVRTNPGGRGGKGETKVRNSITKFLAMALDYGSEAVDLIDILADVVGIRGHKGFRKVKELTAYDKAKLLFVDGYIARAPVLDILKALAINEIQDRIVGGLSRAERKQMRKMGLKVYTMP